MRYLICAIGIVLLLVAGGGCDRHADKTGTVVLHLTVRGEAWRTLTHLQTFVIRAKPGDELIDHLYLREIVSDTSVYLRLTDSSPAFFYHNRRFPEVSDSILVGLHDVVFQKDDGIIGGTTFDYSIRFDTSDYAQELTDCDSIPCRVETTEKENPSSWTFSNISYHSNGQVSNECTDIVVNGRLVQHGMLRAYLFNGQPFLEMEFDSGAPTGVYRGWHSNGHLRFEGGWIDGGDVWPSLRHGVWNYWDTTGRECGRGIFDSGTGVAHWWYADSSPWKVECWTGGSRDSVWYYWYQSGAIMSVLDHRRHSDSAGMGDYSPEGEFLNYGDRDWYDNNLRRSWHGNGQMRTEDGREAYREWYPDGTMSVEAEKIPVPGSVGTTYTRHGSYTEWYPDGSVKTTGQYKNGQASGLWTDWSPTGVKLAEQQAYYTKITQTTFHDNGRPASRGECRGRLKYSSELGKIGVWEYWDTAGELIRTEEWVSGIILYLDGVRTIL